MRITLHIPAERIANLICTAIESGDPVTTASKGGWCDGIYWRSRTASPPQTNGVPWYAMAETFADRFLIEVIEVDESIGHKTVHKINRAGVARGLAIMATKYGERFHQIMADNIDAPCADIFLQCILFGEEKYA